MASDVDSTPASEAAPQSDAENIGASVPGDAYGNSSITAGTPLLIVIPGKPGCYSRLTAFRYTPGATSHTLSTMPKLDAVDVVSEAAAGQASIQVNRPPSSALSGVIAANDFIVVKNENGVYGAYKVASVSGNTIVVTASVGAAGASGFTVKIPKGNRLFYFGLDSDHTTRRFAMAATTTFDLPPNPDGWLTSPGKGQPSLIHINNATNEGFLDRLAYSNPKI